MKFARSKRMVARIPTASMADIAFLLIIFFMVTTVYDVDRTSVALPMSQERTENEKGAAYVVIHKEEDGSIIYKFSGGEKQSEDVPSPNDLFLHASLITHDDPTRQFVLKADNDIRYALVDEVLDQLRKAGVQKLLLLTQQRMEKGGV